jgi:uncharacterized membrane protein
MLSTLFPGIQHMQNIHPLVIHYPIALLSVAALFYLLAWIGKSRGFALSAFLILVLGTISAGAAVAAGLQAEEGVMISASVRAHLLENHEGLMITTLGLSIFLTIWAVLRRPFPQKGRVLFMAIFLGLLIVMSLGADYGGRMVYDYNAGGGSCKQPIEFTR